LRDKLNKKIVDLLIKQELIIKSDIHKQLNEPREIIYYRINNLINYNIVYQIESDNNEISLNPNNKDLIVQIFNDISKFRA